MNENIISAVFDSRSEAETAVRDLRQAGVRDSALSVIARDSDKGDYGDVDTTDADDTGAGGAVTGALVGGGAGALLGIAALAIPGVGPLVAAGAIASSAIPGAAAIGAGVGALAGGVTGLLTDHGVSDEDASYYESRIQDGGVFVSVDTAEAGISAATAQELLSRCGGHSATRARTAAAL